MDEIQTLISQANESLSNENIKEAYFTFLQAIELATRELHSVKFVHNAITSKPPSIHAVIILLQNCIQSTEEILTSRAVGRSLPTMPLIPLRGRAMTPVQLTVHPPTPSTVADDDDGASVSSERSMGSTKSIPPPVPPKPSRMQGIARPPLPPKPARNLPPLVPVIPPERKGVAETSRPRKASVSFAEVEQAHQQGEYAETSGEQRRSGEEDQEEVVVDEVDEEQETLIEDPEEEREADASEDDEDEDENLQEIGRYQHDLRRPESVSFPPQRRASSPNPSTGPVPPPRRPLTVPNNLTVASSSSLSLYSSVPSSPVTSFTTLSKSNFPSSFIPVVPEGGIDATRLVSAQTSSGDSLAPPSSPSNVSTTDHVPHIPIPPLLTTHRTLQTKLDQNESKLVEYRTMKQSHELPDDDNRPSSSQSLSMETIDDAIAKYGATMADTKQTLNRIRTLYMSAATVPTILHFPSHIIAYQLTLIEQAIFLEIPPGALLEHSPRHPHPRIVASTDFFNYLTRLIEHSILLPQEPTIRAQHIHHWVKVAAKCHELQNYQTLKAIVSALGTPPVERLKRTWACIPRKSMQKLESLSELMSEARNYGKYREHMGMQASANVHGMSISVMRRETLKKPTVPFLGTFLHDITYLLAAVKSGNTVSTASLHSVSSDSTYINRDSRDSGVSSLKDEAIGATGSGAPPSPTLSIASTLQPQDDPRIQDLLITLAYYQSGPKYAPRPPSNYIKGSQKSHFRVGSGSLSSALQRASTKKGSTSSSSLMGVVRGYSNDEDEENIESQQQMVTHYLLTRTWVSEKIVDELSSLREPPKRRMDSIGGAGARGSGTTTSMVSNASSVYGTRASIGSTVGASGGSSGSGNESRPSSVDVEALVTAGPASAPALSRRSLSSDGFEQSGTGGTSMSFSSPSSSTQKERKLGFGFGWLPGRSSLEGKRPASTGNITGGTGGGQNSVMEEMIEDSDDDQNEDMERVNYTDEISLTEEAAKEKRQSWRNSAIKVMPDSGIGAQSLRQSSVESEKMAKPIISAVLPKPPIVSRYTRDRSPSEGSPRAPPRSYFPGPVALPNSVNSVSSTSNSPQAATRHSFDLDHIRPTVPTTALPPPPPPLASKPKSMLMTAASGQNLAGMVDNDSTAEDVKILLARKVAGEIESRGS